MNINVISKEDWEGIKYFEEMEADNEKQEELTEEEREEINAELDAQDFYYDFSKREEL